MPCHSPSSNLDTASQTGRQMKQSKLRKGTFSCFECKQRKKRCEFKPQSAAICVACRRLNLPCKSQAFQEDSGQDEADVDRRISHVEGLIKQLVRQRGAHPVSRKASASGREGPLNCRRRLLQPSNSPALPAPIREHWPVSCLSLSGYLQTVLPLPAQAALIISHGKSSFGWMWSQTTVNPDSIAPSWQCSQPAPFSSIVAQPVILARKLVELALSMLQPGFIASRPSDLDLPNEPVAITARRFVGAAQQATSQDLLVRSVDGLETLLLEAVFHVHVGNLEGSRDVFRRAVGLAQSMQLQNLPVTADSRVQYLWFRLAYASVWHDLGNGVASNVVDAGSLLRYEIKGEPTSRKLDRMHIDIAGRIIARNLHLQNQFPTGNANANTEPQHEQLNAIDDYLMIAMRSVPTRWWSLTTTTSSTDAEIVEATAKRQTQIHQSYLTILAHQPFVLAALHSTSKASAALEDISHSRIACLSAARELLARFQNILSFPHVPMSLKGLEHKVYIAGSMALLIHLGENCGEGSNAFEHRRPYDINLIVDTTRHIEELYRYETEASSKTAITLNKLAELEEMAANGMRYRIWSHWCGKFEDQVESASSNPEMSLSYPYFGQIDVFRITKNLDQDYQKTMQS